MPDEVVYENRMSDSDALMWSIERDPVLRSTITGLWLLDQAPDPERLPASLPASPGPGHERLSDMRLKAPDMLGNRRVGHVQAARRLRIRSQPRRSLEGAQRRERWNVPPIHM